MIPDDVQPNKVGMAQRLARRRAVMAVEFGLVPLSDLVTLHGGDAVGEWRQRHLLVLQHSGGEVCPRFALDAEGRPRPLLAELLEVLGAERDHWHVALWLTSPNEGLENRARPVDLLDTDPVAVLEAARRDAGGPRA